MLAVLIAAALIAVGLVPANAVAPLGNSTFLAQTQTQNLSGINGVDVNALHLAQSVTLNGITYYVGNGPTTGPELYSTDGTPANTSIVKDNFPGLNGYTNYLTVSHGQIFMLSTDNTGKGYEPWAYNPSTGQTNLLRDIAPGGNSSLEITTSSAYAPKFTQGPNGLTYFVANDRTSSTTPGNASDNGRELWVTDGAPGGAGTRKVKDINTYSYLYNLNNYWYTIDSNIQSLTSCNGLLFFSANDGWSNTELWATDGTEAGTRMVKDISAGSATTPYRLYSSTLGSDIPSGSVVSTSSNPQNLTCVGNTLFFSADDGLGTGNTLWRSDGTSAGTTKLRSSADGSFPQSPSNLMAFGNQLIFSAGASNYGSPSANYGTELWISDGTTAGTVLLKDINPASSSSSPRNMWPFGGQVYFVASDSRGAELWKTDGTTVGTLFVKDINQTASGASSNPANFYDWNGKLYFTATDGVTGRELYSTTGSGVSTVLVKDIFPGISDILDTSNSSNNIPYFSATTNALVFVANSPIYGQEMWKTDGTESGTTLLQDLNTRPGSANAHDAIAFNGKIYFSAASAYFGQELWSTDLTTGNTQMVMDIYPGASSGMNATASYFTIFQGRLYFVARSLTSGWEVWSTDGTAAGTSLAFDLQPGIGIQDSYEWYHPRYLTVCNNKLFVSQYNGSYSSVFAYDGSGNAPVSMYNSWFYARLGACFNGDLYFQARDASSGTGDYELFKSGGTLATTSKFFDAWNETYVSSGTTYNQSSYPNLFTVVGGKLYFTATNSAASGGTGNELYVYDGTSTPRVVDIWPGASSSSPSLLTNHQGALWFRASSGANGNDLMSYDGTTLTPRDMVAGAAGPSISGSAPFVSSGGLLWFVGSFGGLGFELSTSDGTVANTGTFEDLTPGSGTTQISALTAIGSVLLYNTYDTVMGSQPRFVVASTVNTVTFNSNGANSGVAPNDIAVMAISATVPGNTGAMVKTNFNFTGWNTNSLGTGTTYLPGSTITPIVDTPLYAMWASVTSYTITYNANGATSGVVAPPLTNVTSMVNLDANSGALARTGFRFDGWALNAGGTGTVYASGARYTPTADVIMYAKWTALAPYSISFQLNGATGTAPSTINTYATAVITLPGQGSMVAPTGKTFAGWNTNSAGTGTAYAAGETLSPQSNMTLQAQWASVPASVLTYDANGSSSGTLPASLSATGTYVVIDSNTGNLFKTGFVFSGWNTMPDGSGITYQGTDNYLLTSDITLYAKWTAANYTITFAGNNNTGGTVPAAITGISVSAVLPANSGNLVRAGYSFSGWNTLGSGLGTNYAVGSSISPTSSITLFANWTALPTYTISYSGNGATSGGAPVAQSGVYSSVNLDNNSGLLAKSGSYFAGWNTAADGTGTTYAAGSSFTPTANILLYALWSNVSTYTLSYNSNGSTSGTAPLAQTGIVSSATVSGNTNSLARIGFRFDGWNTFAGGGGIAYAGGDSITLNSDTVLYAQWVSVPTYTITFSGNGQTSGSIPSQITSSDASVTLPGNTGVLNKTNFTFNGWNTAADGTGTHYDVGASFALSANVTLYAEWLGNIYTITYRENFPTSGTAPSATSGRGAQIVSANTGNLSKNGFTFNGWNTAADGTGTNYAVGASITPTQNTNLYARWVALPTYSITFNANGATSGTVPSVITGVYSSTTLPGNTGSLALAARVFGGWNTNAAGTGTTYQSGASFTPSANTTLYAVWNVNYSITYDSNGASSGTVPATQTGLAGTANVLGNTGSLALTGYNFDGWNTNAAGTGTSYAVGSSITSNTDVTLFAKWTPIPTYTISYDSNGATTGTPDMSASGVSSAIVLSNNQGGLAKQGYVFGGWNTQADGLGVSIAGGATYTPTANITLYVLWVPEQKSNFRVTSVAKRNFDTSGGLQTVFGSNLDVVTYVSINGESLTIISSSNSSLTFAITAQAAGWATLTLKSDGMVLNFKNFVQFVEPKSVTMKNFFSKGFSKLTQAQVSRLALEISRSRTFNVVQIGFAENPQATGLNNRTISLQENMMLVKLAMELMKILPKNVEVTLRLTGNTKDLRVLFSNR